MALNLKKILSSAISFSELEAGRTVVQTEDMIKYYPEGFTIIAAERVEMEKPKKGDGVFYDIIIKEDDRIVYRTPSLLTKALDKLMKECDDDIIAFNTALAQGAKTKLRMDKTDEGNNLIIPEFLD